MLATAIEQFNSQDFYACHDTLEALWMEAIEPDRTFYQGLLQLAVGFYHFRNHNWRGAAILLGEGLGRLESYRPNYQDVALEDLLTISRAWLSWIQSHLTESLPIISPLTIALDSPFAWPNITMQPQF